MTSRPPAVPGKPHLRGQTADSLAALCAEVGLAPTLARRLLHRVVGEDRDDIASVRGLAKVAGQELVRRTRLDRLLVLERRRSQADPFEPFVKYLFQARDGVTFEAVRIPLDKPRYSVCISSQAGCALGCVFCETGRMGLTRHLEAWEMVEQVLAVKREAVDRPVTGVVFQGQGEPLHNYDEVMRAAAILRDPAGGRIRGDRITLSTVGLVPEIERFTDEGHPYRLILSLTSAFSERRTALVPLTRTYDVPQVAAALRRHARARGGPVHLAYVLMAGINTGHDEAQELGRLFSGMPLRVSLVEVNDSTGRFTRPGDAERKAFQAALADNGIAFVRRYSGGPDIHAACGMLASRRAGGTVVA